MLTKPQALTEDRFHPNGCTRHVGPRGGIKEKVEEWRRNGATQTWKTRPGEWRIPVKYGIYAYGQIRQYDAANWHTASECPLLQSTQAIGAGVTVEPEVIENPDQVTIEGLGWLCVDGIAICQLTDAGRVHALDIVRIYLDGSHISTWDQDVVLSKGWCL